MKYKLDYLWFDKHSLVHLKDYLNVLSIYLFCKVKFHKMLTLKTSHKCVLNKKKIQKNVIKKRSFSKLCPNHKCQKWIKCIKYSNLNRLQCVHFCTEGYVSIPCFLQQSKN